MGCDRYFALGIVAKIKSYKFMQVEQRQNGTNIKIGNPYADHIIVPIKLDEVYDTATIQILRTQNLINAVKMSTPLQRNQKQCKNIADVLKNQPYFKGISRNLRILLQISQWIEYRRVEEGKMVYEMGDQVDSYFILIKGEVHLTVSEQIVQQTKQNQQQKGNQQEDLKSQILIRTVTAPSASPLLAKKAFSQHELISDLKKSKKMSKRLSIIDYVEQKPPQEQQKPKIKIQSRIIRLVSQGQSFGDVGELNKRTTNATAKQICHLLVIRKQFYASIAKMQLKSQGRQKYDFLSQLGFFKMLYRYSLEAIIYGLEEKKTSYNQIVYTENDKLSSIYVVYKGEYKLYKKVQSKKEGGDTRDNRDSILTVRSPERKVTLRIVGPGQLLACGQAFMKQDRHNESCICKSQQGIILRIDKSKFLKKVLSPDNNIEQISKYIKEQYERTKRQADVILAKQQQDSLYVKYLHTPSARSRRSRTQSSLQKEQSQKKDHFRRLSTSSNFFSEMNKNVVQQPKVRRISINRSLRSKQLDKKVVPSSIKDIVQMVSTQSNYQQIRCPQQSITLFDFSLNVVVHLMQKVPIHIKKKYEFLYRKVKK